MVVHKEDTKERPAKLGCLSAPPELPNPDNLYTMCNFKPFLLAR